MSRHIFDNAVTNEDVIKLCQDKSVTSKKVWISAIFAVILVPAIPLL